MTGPRRRRRSVSASRLAFRLSCRREIWIASSSSSVSASPSASIENGSEPGRENRREYEHPEDQAAPPRPQPRISQHADQVEHDDQQRKLEADTEHQQQVDQEAEILVARQRGHLHVAADGQQEMQRLGQHHVGQHRTGDEQHGRRDDERHREPAFLLVQPRGDERPELVQPHRAGQHHARRSCRP